MALPKARILKAAQAIADELAQNANSWSQSLEVEGFDPDRDYVPEFLLNESENCELRGLEKLRVVVIARKRIRENLTRETEQRDYPIEIGFLKRVDPRRKVAEVDELVYLVEEIENFFSDSHQITGLNALVADATTDPIFDPVELRRNVFASLLTVTVREWLT